ncbi:DNA damage checkpoint protein [Haematococcus lacustris]
MRFKATFTPKGLRILEKAFLPTLEKGGKACHVLLGEEEVNFVQTPFNTDGACVTARFQVDVLFYQDSYVLASKHHNLVAFVVEIGLLLRVLHAVEANEAESLDVKLTQKPVAVPGSTQEVSRPFLSFVGRGSSKSLMLDLPISKPLAPAEVDRLVAVKEVAALSPFYVDLAPCCLMLHALVDKMRSGNDTLMLATCKNGDVLLTVSAVNVALGSHVRQLDVYPQSVAPAAECDRSLPVEQQLHAALQAGDAVAVSLPLKHLARVLNVSLLSAPAQILCGVGEGAAHVHIMFVYRDPSKDHAYDETVALSFRLPVKDEH